MLLVRDQTDKIELQNAKQHETGVEYANRCLSNQILDPLNKIISFVNTLVEKLTPVNDVLIMFDAIRHCGLMIMYSIYDLKDQLNIVNEEC